MTLNKFISSIADKCLPFFKALRTSFSWTEECQPAFEKFKLFLTSPPLLKSLQVGETLYLYLATSEEIVAAVLVRVEVRCCKMVSLSTQIKKLIFSLIVATHKLRLYFQAHPIVVMTSQPIKYILSKADTSERMTKWSIELVEFGVECAPKTIIKGKILVDFIVEFSFKRPISATLSSSQEDINATGGLKTWVVYGDGSTTKIG
ncbi:protein SRG1 [Gossypium australe]|uniref:Protein SRG1 n=1 Tax=Gossypium australe TaxID=47621 RepID=A0A5B6VWU0_9ROSI|nr:protein SRG1 [Gossypium australe]